MRSLQTVAMGLVIVFVDAGSGGWDWVPDPVGWILVLLGLAPLKERLPAYPGVLGSAWVCLVVSVVTLPPDSVDTIAPTLGWLFSVPTLAFSFLLSDSLADIVDESLALRLKVLRVVFVVVGVLPGVVYLAGFEWLTIPAAVLAVLANITVVLTVWAAGDEDEEDGWQLPERGKRASSTTSSASSDAPGVSSRSSAGSPGPPTAAPEATDRGRRKKDQGFDAEEVRRRARARRAREG